MEFQIERNAVVTFSDGSKIRTTFFLPLSNKGISMKDLEKELVVKFNQSQPNMVNKVVNIHLMRN